MANCAALLLLVFEVPSLCLAEYRSNSVRASQAVIMSVLAYLLLRLAMRTSLKVAWMAALVGLGGAWLAFSGIFQFAVGTAEIAAVGLTDFVAFRSRFIHSRLGWVPGECFTVFLLVLPFSCAAAAYLWRSSSNKGKTWLALFALLTAAPIVTVLTLSLSRAVFWSTILFFVMACGLMATYKVVSVRTASLVLAGTLGCLLAVMACETTLYPGIFKAYTGSHTSQMRSTQGRIGIWSRSLELMRGHLLFGVGSANAGLSLLSSADQEETTGFASRAFSLPIQILAEKGLIGFILYSSFLLLICWEFHRGMRSPPAIEASVSATNNKRKASSRKSNQELLRLDSENAHKAMKCCFAAGLAAVLFRELTYSSLLEHTLTLALAFALAALMCAPGQPDNVNLKPVVIGVAGIALILQWPYRRYDLADSKLRDFYSQVASANFNAARESIEGAIDLWPSNARYYGWRGYVESQQLPAQCPRHAKSGSSAMSNLEKQQAQQAAEDYRHSLVLNSRDAVAHHNLAWLEHLLGDDSTAAKDWQKSVEIDPDNAVFHLSYGMFLEESGDAQAAKEQYESAIELTPSILESPFFTRLRSRNPQGAASIVADSLIKLEARLGRGNDPILEARLGKLCLYAGNLGRAAQLLKDASQQLPNLPLVWLNLGELNEAQGDSEQALICYKKARTIEPSLAGPYLRMGMISLHTGQKTSAIHDLSQAVQQWQRINPITAGHNNRLYSGPRQTIDDLLPTTLVWFISPCQSSEAWIGLAQLVPKKPEYAHRSRTCEELPAPHGSLE